MNKLSDIELIELFKQKDKTNLAFNLIVERYKERVYWHIRKIVISHDDTDDIAQNTFVKVWKGLPNFRAESKLFTWIYRIATNEALTFLNKKKKRFFISFTDVEEHLSNSLESDAYFSGDEIQLKLQKALIKLPEKQRIVFNMKYFDEMKYEEISEILGTSIGALKANYHHATKKIKDFFKND